MYMVVLITCPVERAESAHALESCRNVFAGVLTGERVILLGFRMVHA